MTPSYQDSNAGLKFAEFLNSEDGKIQCSVLGAAISDQLPAPSGQTALDAGCGTGWLTKQLSEKFSGIVGCDISPTLIAMAKQNYADLTFEETDISKQRPFPEKQFDVVVANMVLHDCKDQTSALKNIYAATKPGGTVIVTIPNPYYAYPVGSWKRSLADFFMFKNPELKLRPYNILTKQERLFTWKTFIPGYFYPLSEQINNMVSAGFSIEYMEDLNVASDSNTFDLNYRLFRYPVFILLVLKKGVQ